MNKPEPQAVKHPSLAEVHHSVEVPAFAPWWRRWLAVTGPALMVAVGYMDPGNWATDLAGGSRYNYALIWVLLMSNLMAVLLQSLTARLGIVSGRDLAQACREEYPSLVNIPLYLLAEIAITATDLAEVIGSAIALQLLFGLPLLYGVLLTVLDVMLLLALSRFGIRKLEAVVLALVGTIGAAFVIEIFLARPDWGGLLRGFWPALPDADALYIALGILGATVMPHNLYLHSSLVQTRRIARKADHLSQAIRMNTIDSAVCLSLAFFINAAILVMAAAVFYRAGHYGVAEIQDAHRLLEPILGVAIAPLAFAVALLASGQSSTITGTLAGQIVMEGYLNLRIRPWLRRLLTRLLAVLPALAAIVLFGERSTGRLLVLSQVILSLQLPFAVIPLIHFTRDKRRMGEFAAGRGVGTCAWAVALVIVALNLKLVTDEIGGWLVAAGPQAWQIRLAVAFPAVGIVALLVYITFKPIAETVLGRVPLRRPVGVHAPLAAQPPAPVMPQGYKCIAVALDFSGGEEKLLGEALRIAGAGRPRIALLHVVESPVARALGPDAGGHEVQEDRKRLQEYAALLAEQGFDVEWQLETGEVVEGLARMVSNTGAEIVILGGHGHWGLADLIYGTTTEGLRHRVSASILIVPIGDS